ncbi:hypothetical protein OAF47_01920 [bacterium]|jgi:hypothetical protein|nr:hypothetical protein [bacterium]
MFRQVRFGQTKMLRVGLFICAVVLLVLTGCSLGTIAGNAGSTIIVGRLGTVSWGDREEFQVGAREIDIHRVYGLEEQPYMVIVDLVAPVTQAQFSAVAAEGKKSDGQVFVKVELIRYDGFSSTGRLIGVLASDEVKELESGLYVLD